MWLSIAKEAAVRRAAMNYLPMLSHQQLLYLLTMSFISRCAFVTHVIKYLSCYLSPLDSVLWSSFNVLALHVLKFCML